MTHKPNHEIVWGVESTTQSSTNIGFWPRAGAYLLDNLIIFAIQFVIAMIVPKINVFGIIVAVIYFVYFWTQSNGQTLGHKVLGIRVVREDGKPIDITTAIIRYIGYIVSGIVIGLGFFWVIWDPKKQGWHDKMAGTIVVKA